MSAGFLLFHRRIRNNNEDNRTDSGLQREPEDWKTGDEPMTAAQRSYLETLAREADEPVDEDLTKAEASRKIDELRQKSPRITDSEAGS